MHFCGFVFVHFRESIRLDGAVCIQPLQLLAHCSKHVCPLVICIHLPQSLWPWAVAGCVRQLRCVCVCEILYFNYVCVAFNKGYWYRNYSRLWNSSSSVAQISCQQKMICIHMHISHLNVMLEYHSQFIDVKTMRLDWNQIPVQTAILCFIQLNSTLYFTWLKM